MIRTALVTGANRGIGFEVWRAALLAYCAAVFFCRLGSRSVTDADEVRYALTSRTMVVTGDWWTPRFDGTPTFSKPPLFFWLTGSVMKIFGLSEWAVRVLPALAGLACVAALVGLGGRLYGPAAGLWAGFILATAIPFIYEHGCRTGVMDSLLLALICGSFLFLLRSRETSGWILAAAVAMGLASLTKNLMGMLAAAAGVIFLARAGRWRKYGFARLAAASIILLVLSLGWVAAMEIAHPDAFGRVFIGKEIIARAVQPAKFTRTAGGSNFLARAILFGKAAFRGFAPWSFLIPVTCLQAVRRNASERTADELPALWLAVMGLALLAVQSRFPWYAFLAYAPLALLVGRGMADFFSEPSSPVLPVAAVSSVLVGFLFFVPNLRYSPIERDSMHSTVATLSVTPSLGLSFAAAVGAVAGLWMIFRRWPRRALRPAAAAIVFGAATLAALPLRSAGFRLGLDRFLGSLRVTDRLGGERLVLWRPAHTTFLLDHEVDWCLAKYWRGPITEIRSPPELQQTLEDDAAGAWVVPAAQALPVENLSGARELARGELGGVEYVAVGRARRR
jgi:4-amino-4-deoxy-L-arabinose transferase-like glycosyltransferase